MQPILTIDLTHSIVGEFLIPKEWEQAYLGGASLAARILYQDLTADLDPLAPEAPLLFLNGPLSGTAGPAVGRYVVCGKSPATRLWAESNCGGFWGVELRRTGFDGLLITGRAPRATYLWIEEGEVEFKSAHHLWGMETYRTQEAVLSELERPGVKIACIGPAGENQIPFALIMSDHGRMAARTGLGAVMGAKNLKAIAVKGSQSIPLHDAVRYGELRSQTNRELREDPVSQVGRELGTAGVADYFDYLMELPKRYFTRGISESELHISGTSIKNSILRGVSACHACVIACGRVVDLGDGEKRKGAEYETLAGFGPNLLIDDPIRITLMGELCDRYGLDTISMANIIGLGMLLYEKEVISREQTGGLELDWGNADSAEKLIHLTVRKEGIGEYLAMGARRFGAEFGAADAAVQVNDLEVAFHDPRGASGMALVHATSPRGACHNQSDYYLVEVGQVYDTLGLTYYPPRAGAEKTINVVRHQDWRTLFNSLVMCLFANVPPEVVAELIGYAVGIELSVDEMMRIGERGWNLKRVINHRLGLTRENDRLPKALLTPYEDDESGFVPDLPAMLDAYYNTRGWDPETGFPSEEKLESLDLGWLVKDLDRMQQNR